MTDKEKFEKLLDEVFELLYAAANKIVVEEKPCEHEVTATGHTCVGKSHADGGNNRPQCCCAGCRFFDNGCNAEKPLTCKCWLCPVARKKHPTTTKRLGEINHLVLTFNFWEGRADKSESIQLATSAFCYFTNRKGVGIWDYAVGLKELIALIEREGLNVDIKNL